MKVIPVGQLFPAVVCGKPYCSLAGEGCLKLVLHSRVACSKQLMAPSQCVLIPQECCSSIGRKVILPSKLSVTARLNVQDLKSSYVHTCRSEHVEKSIAVFAKRAALTQQNTGPAALLSTSNALKKKHGPVFCMFYLIRCYYVDRCLS